MRELDEQDQISINALKELLPPVVPTPKTLRSRKEYKEWKDRVLPQHFPEEYAWLKQFGSRAHEMIMDILDDEFPEDFQLSERQVREGWDYAAEFCIIAMQVIRRLELTDTILVVQRDKNGEENLVLVRPVLGEFVGRQPINTGIWR